MADNVEVKLGADTGPLKANVADASASIAASLNNIATALDTFGKRNAATTTAVKQSNTEMASSYAQLKAKVETTYAGINEQMLKFRGAVATVAAVLAGGALFKATIDDVTHLQSEVRTLENVMGMMSDKATTTAIALKLIGSSADAYTGIAMKLGRQIKGNEEGLNELGVKTRDAAGALLPFDNIMQNAFKTMLTYKAGTDQAEFALTVFGRGASEVYDIVSKLPAAQQRAAEMQRELGIEMGPKRQAEIGSYKREMAAFQVTLGAIGEHIGMALLPTLKSLAQWFNSVGPTAISVISVAIKGFISLITVLVTAVQNVAVATVAAFQYMQTVGVGAAQVLLAAFSGRFSDIPGIVKGTYASMKNTVLSATDTIVANTKDGIDKINKLWNKQHTPETAGPGPMPEGPNTMPKTPKAGVEAPSIMSNLENELKARESAFNRMKLDEGSFQTWSIEQTRDYWAELRKSDLLGTKDRLSVENKYYDAERGAQEKAFTAQIAGMETQRAAFKHNLEQQVEIVEQEYAKIAQRYGADSPQAEAAARRLVEIRQRLADERIHIAEIESQREQAIAEHAITMAGIELAQAVALRQISADQSFAIQAQLEDKLYQAQRAGIERRKALAGDDLVAQATLDAQLEALEQSHQAKVTQIANAAELDRKQFALAAQEALQTDVANTLADLITKTRDWKDILKEGARQLTADLNRIASSQISKMFLGPGTSGGDMFGGLFSKIFGGGAAKSGAPGADPAAVALTSSATALTTSSTLLDTAATTTSTALTLAATGLEAAGIALSSAAAALAAGGAAKAGGGLIDAAVNMFAGAGQSYAVGTPYVPQDTLAMVHKGEAIIPAKYNNGGLGGGFVNTNQFVLSGPIDTRTQQQIQRSAAEGIRRASLKG